MSAIHTNLNEILKISREYTAQNMRILGVFDLDSTLFNVSTRTKRILTEFAELHQINELKDVEVKPEDWGIKEAVVRAGFALEKDIELLKKLRDFWSERFFSSEYLHFDVPYLGAISFVLDLENSGCEINYLTGRDEKRMKKGSFEVLKKWGFPVNENNLFLKPELQVEDELFKLDWFQKLNHSEYKKIFFFENEPVNINAIKDACPEVEIIYLDTTHARKQEVTHQSIGKIKNFSR